MDQSVAHAVEHGERGGVIFVVIARDGFTAGVVADLGERRAHGRGRQRIGIGRARLKESQERQGAGRRRGAFGVAHAARDPGHAARRRHVDLRAPATAGRELLHGRLRLDRHEGRRSAGGGSGRRHARQLAEHAGDAFEILAQCAAAGALRRAPGGARIFRLLRRPDRAFRRFLRRMRFARLGGAVPGRQQSEAVTLIGHGADARHTTRHEREGAAIIFRRHRRHRHRAAGGDRHRLAEQSARRSKAQRILRADGDGEFLRIQFRHRRCCRLPRRIALLHRRELLHVAAAHAAGARASGAWRLLAEIHVLLAGIGVLRRVIAVQHLLALFRRGGLQIARRRWAADAVGEDQFDDFRKQAVVAIDQLDIFLHPLGAARRNGEAVNGSFLRIPGGGTREPFVGGVELAGIIGIPAERLGTFTGAQIHRHLRVTQQPLGLDIGRDFFGEIAFENIDEQDGIIDQRLPPGIGDFLGLAIHAEFAQRMGEAMGDHRITAALQRQLEPFQRFAEGFRLVIVPGDKAGLVGIAGAARIVLEGFQLRAGHFVFALIVQIGADAHACDVGLDRRPFVGAAHGDQRLDIGHAQGRHRLLDGSEAHVRFTVHRQDRFVGLNRVLGLLGFGIGLGDRPEDVDIGLFRIEIVLLERVEKVLQFAAVEQRQNLIAQCLALELLRQFG